MAPNTASGTLRWGFFASPARLIGLWKPLKLNTMPLVAVAARIAAMFRGSLEPACRPTLKFARWNPAAIKATPVAAGMTSLKAVMPALVLAKSFTPQ